MSVLLGALSSPLPTTRLARVHLPDSLAREVGWGRCLIGRLVMIV